MPSAEKSPSRLRGVLNFLVFLALVTGGGFALVPLWNYLHPATPNSGAHGGGAGSVDAAAPASSSPAPPEVKSASGVLFDGFDYSGTNDPTLKQHGWEVRSALGGPGIKDTWGGDGVSFPAATDAQGGHVLQLQAHTDGTRRGTKQSELESTQPVFFTGTYAARVYFTDGPVSGKNGDHAVESFYTISPPDTRGPYSELDYEYMPNGGWGSIRPELDTTSWHSTRPHDRVYHPEYTRLHGWHILTITALAGHTTYALDGTPLFTNDAAHSPRGAMNVEFSSWLIDLPFTGPRTWNLQVNWFYYQAGKAQTFSEVKKTVAGFYAANTHFVNTLQP